MTEKNNEKQIKEDRIEEIWGSILPTLIDKIQKAENDSYSINLLEEVKMANKFVRETKTNNVSLRVNVDENANSRILAKLFQYKSPDGKYEILQSLLDYIRDRDENAVLNFGKIEIVNNTIITTEETLTEETQNKDNGRIDILVRTGDYAIIFENKLFNAPDQKHQLAKYIKKVNDVLFQNENIFVIYLSSYGDEPADNSWVKPNTTDSLQSSFKDRYANLSFKDDILPWLKDYVLPNVRKKDTDLESALVQYINYLDRMFMKNNDNLTKWLEDKLKNEQQWKDSNETGRLEKVEELLDYLSEEGKKGLKNRNYSVQQLRKLIGKTNDNTNVDPLEETDLLNKVIDVIENLRDDCRKEVLKPFYCESKNYFDIIHVSSLSAAYCWLLKNKKWEGEIRFIWDPFFFNANKKYKLKLEIILTDDETENGNRIKKFETKTVKDAINKFEVPKLTIQGVNKIHCDKREQAVARAQRLLQINLETDKKLLYFDPDDQEKLFRAIYDSLSGVIDAIDNCFQNHA